MAEQREHPRLQREHQTIGHMVRIYCQGHHNPGAAGLCAECEDFLSYADQRLTKCRYQELKPTCGNCPKHCYRPSMKDKALKVMSYAGPRMSWRHPYLALRHSLDSLIKPPPSK